jgi:hypothetical protein
VLRRFLLRDVARGEALRIESPWHGPALWNHAVCKAESLQEKDAGWRNEKGLIPERFSPQAMVLAASVARRSARENLCLDDCLLRERRFHECYGSAKVNGFSLFPALPGPYGRAQL